MPSKELIEKVAREICLVAGRMGDPLPIELQRVDRDWRDHKPAAQAAISTILAALQEPNAEMIKALWSANASRGWPEAAKTCWQSALAASALGEQSE